MYFELQLSSDVFTRIVRNRLKALAICPDRDFEDKDGKLAGTAGAVLVVDRVEIGDTTFVQREETIDLSSGWPKPVPTATQVVWTFRPTNYSSATVPFLQVKQELLVHLVKATDLQANGPAASPVVKTLTVYAALNVALQPSQQTQGGGPVTLSYALAHVDLGIYGLSLTPVQRADIEQFAAAIQLPPTTLDLGALGQMLKQPVSAINAGITCHPSGAFVVMRVDLDVHKTPAAVEPAFFRDDPEDLLAGGQWALLVDAAVLVEQASVKAKGALESDPKVRLRSGPHVAWNPGAVAIDIDAGVELVDACPFFIDDIDMDVDVDIRTSFSVPAANILRTHYYLTGEASDVGEEIACAVTGALLWPFVGPLFLKDEEAAIGLGAYFGGLAGGPPVTFIGIIAAIETKKLSKDLSEKLGATCKKLDDENYECNDPMQPVMQLSPGFNSTLDVLAARGLERGLVIGGGIGNLGNVAVGNLDAVHVCPFDWQVRGRCTGNGESNFRIANQASLSVQGTPPARLCKAYLLPGSDPQGEFTLSMKDDSVVIVAAFGAGYLAAPYPCRVRVITTRGVRTITFTPPAGLGDAERERLETERLGSHMSCYYWEKMFTPIEKVKWLPDPPFDAGRVIQFWQIAVRGLQAEEAVAVAGRDGAPLLLAQPSRAGVAHVTLARAPGQAIDELALELRGRRGEDTLRREITVQQVAFVQRARLPVAGAVHAMRFEGSGGSRRLVVRGDDGEAVWNVGNPTAPQLVQSSMAPSESRRDRPAVVVHGGKRMGEPPTPTLLRALERLQHGGGAGAVAIGSPRLAGVKETLYLRTAEGATLFDISSGDEPRPMHVYEGPAWFEGLALGGKLLARHILERGVIELYVAERERSCR